MHLLPLTGILIIKNPKPTVFMKYKFNFPKIRLSGWAKKQVEHFSSDIILKRLFRYLLM